MVSDLEKQYNVAVANGHLEEARMLDRRIKALTHKIRPGGTVHAMDCKPCSESEHAGKPHLDPRYETYWSM